MIDALFLSPHPDDVELFCGGTVARLAAAGRRVLLADCTRGELASNGTPEGRREQSLRAARHLGALEERPVLGLPDGGLDSEDPAQTRAVAELIRRWRPRLLVAPFPRDRHPDHEAGGRLARRAAFFAGLARAELEGEPHRPAALLFYACHGEMEPHFLVDVSDHMAVREQAVLCYEDQWRGGEGRVETFINRPGFLDGITARLAAWGARRGVAHAEGFRLEEIPLVEDPVAWLDPEGEDG